MLKHWCSLATRQRFWFSNIWQLFDIFLTPFKRLSFQLANQNARTMRGGFVKLYVCVLSIDISTGSHSSCNLICYRFFFIFIRLLIFILHTCNQIRQEIQQAPFLPKTRIKSTAPTLSFSQRFFPGVQTKTLKSATTVTCACDKCTRLRCLRWKWRQRFRKAPFLLSTLIR